MFFKRGLAAILAAVTVVGLAGCGDSDKAADTDEATVKDGLITAVASGKRLGRCRYTGKCRGDIKQGAGKNLGDNP